MLQTLSSVRISNNVKIGVGAWVRRNGLFKLKGQNNLYAQKSMFLCKNLKICNRLLVDSTLSEHLNHHEWNNILKYKRGRCLFMISYPERCTDSCVRIYLSLYSNWRMGGSEPILTLFEFRNLYGKMDHP